MNNTSHLTKLQETKSQEIGGYGYTIGVCVGVLITVMIMTYISYLCQRLNASRASLDATMSNDSTNQDGLAKDILSSYPKFTYIQLELCKGDSTALGCCICLADYKETDLLRLLPDCGHIFHLKCVDPWLMVHATCPICRNSPLPSTTTVAPSVHIDVM